MHAPTPYPEMITKDEVNLLPLGGYEGPIEVVRTQAATEAAVARLAQETVLGFDTETRPAFRPGVSYLPALIQLAGSDTVYLFQLPKIPEHGPLFDLLANGDILKPGVGWALDASELQQVRRFEPRGFVELGDMSTRAGIINNGLRALTAIVLGIRISKSAQRSNWAADTLSPSQIRYAATDAWVGREIFLRLRERGVEVPPQGPPPPTPEEKRRIKEEKAASRRRRRRGPRPAPSADTPSAPPPASDPTA